MLILIKSAQFHAIESIELWARFTMLDIIYKSYFF